MATSTVLNSAHSVYLNIDDNNNAIISYPTMNFYYNANFSKSFFNCSNLVFNSDQLQGRFDLVTNMRNSFYYCYNIIGSPICGPNVTTMQTAYIHCHNLINSPVCGTKVTSMYYAYQSCYNLTGDLVCGPNGTVSIMSEEEEMRYPSRIIGTISEIPSYDIWEAGHNGDHQIKVNGRIWIRIR